MNKTYSTIAIVTLTILFGVMTFLYLEKGKGDRDHGGPKRGRQMIKALQLTPEQQEQMKEIRSQGEQAFKDKRTAVESAQQKLTQEIKNPEATNEELLSLYSDLEKARQDLAAVRFQQILAIRELLTPEQKSRFEGSMERSKHRGFK